jgi:hypothetical protein
MVVRSEISCTTADAVPKAFGCRQAIFELVHVLAHHKETFIGLANTSKCIEEGVRKVINDTLRLFGSWGMCNMLVHDYMPFG